jgi:tetrahydromethanopterin S-methyltransferase subunit G
MVCLQTKNPNLGTFERALEWTLLVYFMVIWNILRSFGIFYGILVMLWLICIFSLVLVYCVNKNLATLHYIIDKIFSFPLSLIIQVRFLVSPTFSWLVCCYVVLHSLLSSQFHSLLTGPRAFCSTYWHIETGKKGFVRISKYDT